MDAKYEQINLGANICEKIKIIFYPDHHWQACYQQVAGYLTQLKAIMRKFYAGQSDLEILKHLVRYSTDDIREAFENDQSDGTGNNRHQATSAGQAEPDTGTGIAAAKTGLCANQETSA